MDSGINGCFCTGSRRQTAGWFVNPVQAQVDRSPNAQLATITPRTARLAFCRLASSMVLDPGCEVHHRDNHFVLPAHVHRRWTQGSMDVSAPAHAGPTAGWFVNPVQAQVGLTTLDRYCRTDTLPEGSLEKK